MMHGLVSAAIHLLTCWCLARDAVSFTPLQETSSSVQPFGEFVAFARLCRHWNSAVIILFINHQARMMKRQQRG